MGAARCHPLVCKVSNVGVGHVLGIDVESLLHIDDRIEVELKGDVAGVVGIEH